MCLLAQARGWAELFRKAYWSVRTVWNVCKTRILKEAWWPITEISRDACSKPKVPAHGRRPRPLQQASRRRHQRYVRAVNVALVFPEGPESPPSQPRRALQAIAPEKPRERPHSRGFPFPEADTCGGTRAGPDRFRSTLSGAASLLPAIRLERTRIGRDTRLADQHDAPRR